MKFTRNTLILLAITAALSGCVITIDDDDYDDDFDNREHWQETQSRNSGYIDRLDIGTALADIKADLGEPEYTESFKRNDDVIQVLYYRTRHMRSDGKTSQDETTPLVFIDRQLVGWGVSAIDRATR